MRLKVKMEWGAEQLISLLMKSQIQDNEYIIQQISFKRQKVNSS